MCYLSSLELVVIYGNYSKTFWSPILIYNGDVDLLLASFVVIYWKLLSSKSFQDSFSIDIVVAEDMSDILTPLMTDIGAVFGKQSHPIPPRPIQF
jgi:hypothetical protein